MKKLLLLALIISTVSCGRNVRDACHIIGNDVVCPKDGTSLTIGVNGENGTNGVDGLSPQIDIIDATVDQCPAGGSVFIVTTDIIQTAIICDGSDAETSPLSITEIIDPCGDAPGIYDEVLLRLADRTIIASFSDNVHGDNTHFALLPAGNYMTTDGSHCYFSVNANGDVL